MASQTLFSIFRVTYSGMNVKRRDETDRLFFIFLAATSCKEDIYPGITFEAPVFKDSLYVEATPFRETLLTRFAWGMAYPP